MRKHLFFGVAVCVGLVGGPLRLHAAEPVLTLAGSIRDDGPLPEVIPNVYEAQDAMRMFARKAATVIAMATQLQSFAFGNMTPNCRVLDNGRVRPVHSYVVDSSYPETLRQRGIKVGLAMDLLAGHAGLRRREQSQLPHGCKCAKDRFVEMFDCPAFLLELSLCSYVDPETQTTRAFSQESLNVVGRGLARAIAAHLAEKPKW